MVSSIRRRISRRKFLLFSCFLAVWSNSAEFAGAQQQHHPDVECSPTEVQYDWERWNYYELLGLPRPSDPATVLDSKSIRRSYRKQAQIWHPDKQSNSTSSNEESTARFAQIAQAYEVLSDDWKRREYNLYLQYCDTMEEKEAPEPRWSKLFSKIDPFSVFEKLFFGKDYTDDDEDQESSWFSDMQPQNSEPVRVTKHQDEFRNGMEEILRVSQTEEFAPDASGRYYYRIVSQDYVKRVDPYTGNVVLKPVTNPYLREEGHQKKRSSQLPRQSLLFPGDVMTPASTLLVSPNRRFYAGLSPDCELVIMADNAFGEDTPVWTSESPFASSDYCFATLRGPHLVIALGRPEMPHRILWYSEANQGALEAEDEDEPFYSSASYLAQLENDGSLVVYKVWSPSQFFHELPLSSKAWWTARNFMDGATRDDQYESLLVGDSSPRSSSIAAPTFKRCMYATGPSGCYRLARKIYQLSLEIMFRVKFIMGKMDAMIDTWMDLITEEENYLQALMQSTSGLGGQIFTKSARLVRRVLELIMMRGDK